MATQVPSPVRADRAADALSMPAGDPIYLSRLRWRCRRGMLENDLVLARFLDARGASLTPVEVAALDRALDLPDGELWDLIARRAEPADPALRAIVDALREA
jgi:antitoxin CptB